MSDYITETERELAAARAEIERLKKQQALNENIIENHSVRRDVYDALKLESSLRSKLHEQLAASTRDARRIERAVLSGYSVKSYFDMEEPSPLFWVGHEEMPLDLWEEDNNLPDIDAATDDPERVP